MVQHPNTGGNIDVNLNLSKSKDKKSKTQKSKTVKEREDQIEELSEKSVAKASGEKEKSVSRAAGKKKRVRKKKISKESTSASPCHDQQVDKAQVKGNESKQITKNVDVVNNSKTEINNIALNMDNVDSLDGSEQHLGDIMSGSEQDLGDTISVTLSRVQTEKVTKNMSFNNKGKKIKRRKTTDNVGEEIQRTRGGKSNVAKYKRGRRSAPNIKLLEEGGGEYLTVRNLSQYEQKISEDRRSKNSKKSFNFDSSNNSTISEDIVYVEKAVEHQTDRDNQVSQREDIEDEEVQKEDAFDIEEPQADLENQVSRREDIVDNVNVRTHTNREADVEEKLSETKELYHGDEEEMMTGKISLYITLHMFLKSCTVVVT